MRSQRFWMPVGMLAASFIGGGLATVGFADKGPAIPEVIKARSFEVVGADGKVHGIFGLLSDGVTGMILTGFRSGPGGGLDVTIGDVSLTLLDKDGTIRGCFGLLSDVFRSDRGLSLGLFEKEGRLIFLAP